MRRRLVLAIAIGALAAPASAPAKGISEVAVCGAGQECVRYDRSDVENLSLLAQDAGPTDPPAAAAPWYRVRFTVDAREHGGGIESWTVAYVPAADSLRVREGAGRFTWVALRPTTARVLERAARRLPALPKAELRGLEPAPPRSNVDEVVTFGDRAGATVADGTPWGWIAGGGALAAAVPLLWIAARRRSPVAGRRRAAPEG